LVVFGNSTLPCGPGDIQKFGYCIPCSTVTQNSFANSFQKCVKDPRDCGFGKFGNIRNNQCESCPSEQYVSVDHKTCLPSKADCGIGASVISGTQCQACDKLNPSFPFTSPNHDLCLSANECSLLTPSLFGSQTKKACVSAEDCGFGYYGNIASHLCEACPESNYISLDHKNCFASKAMCGNGNSVLNGSQCVSCLLTNSSLPFANSLHDQCGKASDCGIGEYGNPTTKQCQTCPSLQYAILDHKSCVPSRILCGPGNVVLGYSSKQCVSCPIISPEAPIANTYHNSCILASECPDQFYADKKVKQCVLATKYSDFRFGHPYNKECVSSPQCPDGFFANQTTKLCQQCPLGNITSFNKTICLNLSTQCGDGNIVVNFSCKSCKEISPTTPFANENHTLCINDQNCGVISFANPLTLQCGPVANCGNDRFGNTSSGRCDICPPNTYSNLAHSSCLTSKEQCGDGNIGRSAQCYCCKDLSTSIPNADPNHEACVGNGRCGINNSFTDPIKFQCVSPENCSNGYFASESKKECVVPKNCSKEYFANLSSKKCDICPTGKFASGDHTQCFENIAQCEKGYIVNNSFQCEICQKDSSGNILFANIYHNSCIAALTCGPSLYGNPNTFQCGPLSDCGS